MGRKDREVYAALPDLRDLQQRILDRIIKHATFPDYLYGGIRGRSYISNAQYHANSTILFGQDVSSFFPSISVMRIESIFAHVFRFPRVVAALLARLCCRAGELAQGGVASTHLANLALYTHEPELEAKLRARGLRYSRFVDDLHVSASRRLRPPEVTEVVRAMRHSLERQGFTPKRKKQFVTTSGSVMRVHALNVNVSVSSPARRRQKIRNEVFLLEKWTVMQSWDSAMERCYLSLCSKVGHLAQLNAGDARRLKSRLNGVAAFRL
jgi:hypothetical protein